MKLKSDIGFYWSYNDALKSTPKFAGVAYPRLGWRFKPRPTALQAGSFEFGIVIGPAELTVPRSYLGEGADPNLLGFHLCRLFQIRRQRTKHMKIYM
jgi:hypothetical protein